MTIHCKLELLTKVDRHTHAVYCTTHGMLGSIPRTWRMRGAKLEAKAEEMFSAHACGQATGEEFPDVTDPAVRECLTLFRASAELRARAERNDIVLLDKLSDDLTAEQRAEYGRVLQGGSP